MKNAFLRDIARDLGAACESEAQVSDYQIDSRKVSAGSLFFALAGEKVDGHQFLRDAARGGAVGAVVNEGYGGSDFGLVLVRVADVKEALQKLGRIDAERSGAFVIGVTGSVGKTTTKEFIAALLDGSFRVGKNWGSYNTKLTLPLTILNRSGEEQVLVLEMGMNEPGEMEKLVEIAQPDIAVLTKVAMAHVGAFEDGLLGIAREKGKIFLHPKTSLAIFDLGFLEFGEAVEKIGCAKLSFALNDKSADYALRLPEGDVDEKGVRAHRFDLPFQEPHLLHDFLAAVAVARALKIDWDTIQKRSKSLEIPKMRFERFEKDGVVYVNDAYNANPESMRAALESFPEPKSGGKKIAVLGTMVELGSFSQRCHEEIGRLAQIRADYLLTFGEEAKVLSEAFAEGKKPAEHFDDKRTLAKRLKELAAPGDAVLVKASRSVGLETVFEELGV